MNAKESFLGSGWSFPPLFNRHSGSVEMVADEENIQQSLLILLSTDPGERLMRPDFGCDLKHFQFAEIDTGLLTRLKTMITKAVLLYEPRVLLENVVADEKEDEPGVLTVEIQYIVRATNSRFNLVFPFYLNENTTPW